MFNPLVPYNNLPLLPPSVELETKKVLRAVITASRALAELNVKANEIPNQTILLNAITLQEAKDSSQIEHIFTTHDNLYQAFSTDQNKLDPNTKEVLRYRKALWNGYKNLSKRPLSTNTFISIVQTIKENNFGIRNFPGTKIVSNHNTIYTPPQGDQLIRNLLQNLETYIHNKSSVDVLIRLAVMHYQFEAIHPFMDGNGRTGRIINILYLVEMGLLKSPILYLSKYILENKSEYNRYIHAVTENNEWENWILFILRGIEHTAFNTIRKIDQIRNLITLTTAQIKKNNLPKTVGSNEFVDLLFEQPYCKVKFILDRGIAKRHSASTYLKQLENINILISHKIGREILYLNRKLFEILIN